MEPIFSNCDGCERLAYLTHYHGELLCDRCLRIVDNSGDETDDDKPFFIEDGF